MKYIRFPSFGLTLAFFLVDSAVFAADLPQGMLDFDRQMAFTKPMLITVFRGYQDEHTYFVLPNAARIDQLSNNSPKLSLLYGEVAMGRRALLTLEGTVGFANDYPNAIEEISKTDAVAKFIVPEPSAFSFTIGTPGSDKGGATIENSKIDSSGHFEIMAKVADITSRILLIPESYKFDSLSVVYSPTYRGIVRTPNGTPMISERTYNLGIVSGGACALSPERYVSWINNKAGCIFPNYPWGLVRSIQISLKRAGFYDGTVDGQYGPLTNQAIRQYQISRSITGDGIPTPDLAKELAGL